MYSIYDNFRSVQRKRAETFNKRSATFIEGGKLSKLIYHKRNEKNINAGIVYQYKEGPDEIIIFTNKVDQLLKGDYFILHDANYLVYEDVKLADEEIPHKKQKALECNVSFVFKEKSYFGYFTSSLRAHKDPSLQGKEVLLSTEKPLLILKTTSRISIGDIIEIEQKPWKIVEYDDITNRGITYYYLERDATRNSLDKVEVMDITYLRPSKEYNQSSLTKDLVLMPMTEYTFKTEDGYFVSTPRIDIISRTPNEIVFAIPFSSTTVTIETKEDGDIISKSYLVEVR